MIGDRNNKEINLEIPTQLPFLEAICWQTSNVKQFTPNEMLNRYERGWHYRGVLAEPSKEELAFIEQLAKFYYSWLAAELNVSFNV